MATYVRIYGGGGARRGLKCVHVWRAAACLCLADATYHISFVAHCKHGRCKTLSREFSCATPAWWRALYELKMWMANVSFLQPVPPCNCFVRWQTCPHPSIYQWKKHPQPLRHTKRWMNYSPFKRPFVISRDKLTCRILHMYSKRISFLLKPSKSTQPTT